MRRNSIRSTRARASPPNRRDFEFGGLRVPTWTDDVFEALTQLGGGPVHLDAIYERTAQLRRASGRRLNSTFENTIRRTLQERCEECLTDQRGSPLFRKYGDGLWGLL